MAKRIVEIIGLVYLIHCIIAYCIEYMYYSIFDIKISEYIDLSEVFIHTTPFLAGYAITMVFMFWAIGAYSPDLNNPKYWVSKVVKIPHRIKNFKRKRRLVSAFKEEGMVARFGEAAKSYRPLIWMYRLAFFLGNLIIFSHLLFYKVPNPQILQEAIFIFGGAAFIVLVLCFFAAFEGIRLQRVNGNYEGSRKLFYCTLFVGLYALAALFSRFMFVYERVVLELPLYNEIKYISGDTTIRFDSLVILGKTNEYVFAYSLNSKTTYISHRNRINMEVLRSNKTSEATNEHGTTPPPQPFSTQPSPKVPPSYPGKRSPSYIKPAIE